jgi:hypothetical protein
MQRLLDLDLDFFLHGAAHDRGRDHPRLDPDHFPVWSVDETFAFLRKPCGLTGRLPGWVVEHHGELFERWRDGLDVGLLRAPFHVTHVDAHADLGVGDCGWMHLTGDLMFRKPEHRRDPGDALEDGNYLAFAAACRWLGELDFVFNDHREDDIMPLVMERFDPRATHLQLAALTHDQIAEVMRMHMPKAVTDEPRIPFRALSWREFRAQGPYDLICLAHSPEFTPPTADDLFNAIREHFIDEIAAG